MQDNWIRKEVREIAHIEKGKKPRILNSIQNQDSPHPYVDIQAFEKGIITKFTDGEKCRPCNKGDLLIVWDGSRSGLVGKGIDGFLGSTIAKITFDGITSDFGYYFLQSKYHKLNSRTKGSGTPHVDPELLKSFKISIPPPNIQQPHRLQNRIPLQQAG